LTAVTRMNPKKTLKIVLLTVIAVVAFAVLYFVISNLVMVIGTRDRIYDLDSISSAEPESFDCILVLGCGVYSDGTPTPFLSDRLETAVELYKDGISDKILLTGDHINENYNETGAMRRYCLDNGVPEEAILIDDLGLSTYESMYRAKNLFNIDSAVIVTQKYHIARAVYNATSLGIRCRGVCAINSGYVVAAYNYVRESIARSKDFILDLIKADPGTAYKSEAGDTVVTALIYGIMWSFLYSAYYSLGLKLFPGNFIKDFPVKVRQEAQVRARISGTVYKTVALVILYSSLLIFPIAHFEIRIVSYLTVISFVGVITVLWSLIRLFVINGFIRCVINPKWLRITDTEEDYRNMGSYLKRFASDLACSIAATFVIGSISYFILDLALWL